MSDDSAMSEDDQPLASQNSRKASARHVATNGAGSKKKNKNISESDLSDEDETPLSQTARATKHSPIVRPQKRKKAYQESSSEDDKPLAMKTAEVPMPGALKATTVPTSAVKGTGKAKKNISKEEVADADDTPKKPSAANGKAKSTRQPPKKKVKKEESDDDEPMQEPAATRRKRKSAVKQEESDAEESSEDEKPKKKPAAKKARISKLKKEEDVSDSADLSSAAAKRKAAKEKKDTDAASRKAAKLKKKEEEDAEAADVFRWWETNPGEDGSVKWHTLEHNGVIFPPMYEPLPSSVKMKYNGQDVDLPPEAEEVAGFYAAMLETPHAEDVVFNKNFFEDWKGVMKAYPPRDGTRIIEFSQCDFRPMFDYFEQLKAEKKALSGAERKELKRLKDEMEAKYITCLLDGRKEKVGNFRVEPPGLFRGRGEHPKKGALKHRVRPEDIILNIGENAPVPIPNMPGKWKAIQHDNTVTWLANWTENVNSNHKYVFLAPGSSLKGQSDMTKFEKARELKKHVDAIRRDYNEDLKSKVMADRQRATAMYFIDKLALRAGNEKGEDEADTVGCCSLRCEHVTLAPPDLIIFDFLGKDSIRYYKEVPVDTQVYKNIRIFKDNKNDDDDLFDRVSTSIINKHLTSYMKGLTAKVFRTFNASFTFQRLLDEPIDENATVQEKLNAYNKANRLVAILCNHKRSIPKTHDASMDKLRHRLRGFKYDRMKLRHVLFATSSSYKKNPKYKDDESDIDDEFIASYEDENKAKEIEKANKKFAKDNEKRVEDGKEELADSTLAERIADIEEEFSRLESERGTAKATLKKEKSVEKIEELADKLEEKIKTFKLQMDDRGETKEVALGTSKINYLDPRITAAWCKIHDVPIEKIFSKTLLTKFPWALEVDPEWKF